MSEYSESSFLDDSESMIRVVSKGRAQAPNPAVRQRRRFQAVAGAARPLSQSIVTIERRRRLSRTFLAQAGHHEYPGIISGPGCPWHAAALPNRVLLGGLDEAAGGAARVIVRGSVCGARPGPGPGPAAQAVQVRLRVARNRRRAAAGASNRAAVTADAMPRMPCHGQALQPAPSPTPGPRQAAKQRLGALRVERCRCRTALPLRRTTSVLARERERRER